MDQRSPFTPEAFSALRAHPAFRAAVEHQARGNLANYAGLPLIERWLVSDLGRAGLTGAVLVLDALNGGVTAAAVVESALRTRACSEGRARDYVRRAVASGFLAEGPDGRLTPTPRLYGVSARMTATLLASAALVAPELAPAAAQAHDLGFRRRMLAWTGVFTAQRPDVFAGPDMPIMLFMGRDGGMRMLEQLIAQQPARRIRLLEDVAVSQSALARAAFASRTHVSRLLADGEAQGLLAMGGGRLLQISPRLSDDVERHYALMFETARMSALRALAG